MAARHTAPAFHDSFSLRGAPVRAGASEAVLQSGNWEKSMPEKTARGEKACAPSAPAGPANAAARPACSNVRRSIGDFLGFCSLAISVPALAKRRHLTRNAIASRALTWTSFG